MPMTIKYVYHFDELTWIPGIVDRQFFELTLPYNARAQFVSWLTKNCQGTVYVWAGVVTPIPGSHNWGTKVAPDENIAFLAFEDDQDQTRFSLEFVGSADILSAKVYKNGISAYHWKRST